MQNDLVKQGGSLLVPDAEATIAAITALLELARASGMRVVYSQDTHRRGDPEWDIWPEHCREGSWGWEIVAELAPRRLCSGMRPSAPRAVASFARPGWNGRWSFRSRASVSFARNCWTAANNCRSHRTTRSRRPLA